MIERLDKVEERYKEIQEKLSTDEVIQDVKKTTELSKELRSLEDVVNAYNEYKTILNGITEAKEMENHHSYFPDGFNERNESRFLKKI